MVRLVVVSVAALVAVISAASDDMIGLVIGGFGGRWERVM